jgi:zinc/manganese transport system permease protein
MTDLLLWPFVAGLVLTAIHAWFGLHVLARGVVFVDLSLAQVAALGLTIAILAGHPVQSTAAYWYALAFALGGAVLFALTRRFERHIQQEAVIGIVYAVSASLAVLALDRAPQGAEHVKQLLIGSILTVTPEELGGIAALYAAIGLLHFAWRRGLVEVSFDPQRARLKGRHVFFWDCVFYGSFALVVTSSVRVAGVLLVFAYLIIPAALAALFARTLGHRLLLAWALGAVLTAGGLHASWVWDLPTGPAIVSAFGAAMVLVGLGAVLRMATARTLAQAVFAAIAIAGLLLAAFPRMDQPWLDTLHRVAAPLETVFLDEHERATRADTIESLQRARGELARLRDLEQEARWGRKDLDPEKLERLRQYIAGRSEIAAGEELVLRDLRETARGRQRWLLGLPLLLIGATGFHMLRRSAVRRPDRGG